jgi:hypothetical protein
LGGQDEFNSVEVGSEDCLHVVMVHSCWMHAKEEAHVCSVIHFH